MINWKQEWEAITSTDALFAPDPEPGGGEDYKKIKVTDYSYSKIESAYKKDGQGILDSESCLAYLRNTTPPTNTCAIKLSWALNAAGYNIPNGKYTPGNVRTQNNPANPNKNYILDAASMVNYLCLIEKPTYGPFRKLDTEGKINEAIDKIHLSDDMRGIVGLVAGKPDKYGATGHVDLLYEDGAWDLSLFSYDGADLDPYLKSNLDVEFDLYVWVLEQD